MARQAEDDRKCQNCWFFEPFTNVKTVGECHRYPPTMVKTSFLQADKDYTSLHFPIALGADWCGEWQPERAGVES